MIEEPAFIRETSARIMVELAESKHAYIVSAMQQVGIDPDILIEQTRHIYVLTDVIEKVVALHRPTWIDDYTNTGRPACVECSDPENDYQGLFVHRWPCRTWATARGLDLDEAGLAELQSAVEPKVYGVPIEATVALAEEIAQRLRYSTGTEG